MRRLIKAHLVNRSNQPAYRSKPVTHAILNLDLNSNWSNRPVNRYEPVELSFLNSNLNSTDTYVKVSPLWLKKVKTKLIPDNFELQLIAFWYVQTLGNI